MTTLFPPKYSVWRLVGKHLFGGIYLLSIFFWKVLFSATVLEFLDFSQNVVIWSYMTCIFVFAQLPLETLNHSVVLRLSVSMRACYVVLTIIWLPCFSVFKSHNPLALVVHKQAHI